jgi:hypothetical protein
LAVYIRGVLPWLLIGPISGPLAEGIVRNWRKGEFKLARLYAIALILATIDLYTAGGKAVVFLVGWTRGLL